MPQELKRVGGTFTAQTLPKTAVDFSPFAVYFVNVCLLDPFSATPLRNGLINGMGFFVWEILGLHPTRFFPG